MTLIFQIIITYTQHKVPSFFSIQSGVFWSGLSNFHVTERTRDLDLFAGWSIRFISLMIQTSHCHFLLILIFLPLKFISWPRPDLSSFVFSALRDDWIKNTCIYATDLFDWSQTLRWYLFIHMWCNAYFQFAWATRPIKKRKPWNSEPFACCKKPVNAACLSLYLWPFSYIFSLSRPSG